MVCVLGCWLAALLGGREAGNTTSVHSQGNTSIARGLPKSLRLTILSNVVKHHGQVISGANRGISRETGGCYLSLGEFVYLEVDVRTYPAKDAAPQTSLRVVAYKGEF
jgi:hypothetical protein